MSNFSLFLVMDEIEIDVIFTDFQSSSKVNELFSKIRAIFSGYLFAEFFKKSIIFMINENEHIQEDLLQILFQ